MVDILGRRPFVCRNLLPDGTACDSTQYLVSQLTDAHWETVRLGADVKVGGTGRGSAFLCTKCRKIFTPDLMMERIRADVDEEKKNP